MIRASSCNYNVSSCHFNLCRGYEYVCYAGVHKLLPINSYLVKTLSFMMVSKSKMNI